MKTRHLTAGIAIAALLFVGSGCSGGDFAMIFSFLSEWSQAQGLTDHDGKPTLKAGKVYMFGSGDPMVDAAVNAGATTEGVRAADKAMAEADDALGGDKPDYGKAEEKLDVAAKARPNDWAVLNRQYALEVEQGRTGQSAEAKKSRADNAACKTNSCKASMLEDRVRALDDSDVRLAKSGASMDRKCIMLKEQRNANGELGRQYEIMQMQDPAGGVEGIRNRERYSNLANHYLTTADNYANDYKKRCGGGN